jgi:RecA/RadA recombinase
MARAAKTTKTARKTRAVKEKKGAPPKKGRVSKSATKKTKAKKGEEDIEEKTSTKFNAGVMFYGKVLDLVEKKTRMPSNSLKYMEPLSTGMLQLDRALSGGWHNVFSSIAGPEASGKTTAIYHGMANALRIPELKFCLHIEPEGTLNTEFAGNVFSQFGLNYQDLMDDENSPLRYYRKQVIEQVFDLMHGVLKRMPDKVWVPQLKSWGYVIPKRDKYWASVMEAYGVEPDKKLSTDLDYLCPTEYGGIEGGIFLDSLAAMVTENDDEKDQRSKIRAAEASAFSLHLKRVVSRIASKGLVFPAVNQLRTVPGQTYGDPNYEPGGGAIKFYSAQRLRITARAAPEGGATVRDKDTPEQALEPSVHRKGAMDRYKYKFFKNTKNKIGFPGLRGWMRVWVADAFGAVRGFDPYFDTLEYLKDTGQIKMAGRGKKGGTTYEFCLKESVGKKRANLMNELPEFTLFQLKQMILAEVEGNNQLFRDLGETLDVNPSLLKRTGLRAALFQQIRVDRSILQIKAKDPKKEEEDEEDVDEL